MMELYFAIEPSAWIKSVHLLTLHDRDTCRHKIKIYLSKYRDKQIVILRLIHRLNGIRRSVLSLVIL